MKRANGYISLVMPFLCLCAALMILFVWARGKSAHEWVTFPLGHDVLKLGSCGGEVEIMLNRNSSLTPHFAYGSDRLSSPSHWLSYQCADNWNGFGFTDSVHTYNPDGTQADSLIGVVTPDWFLCLLVLLLCAAEVTFYRPKLRQFGHCPRCGYDVRRKTICPGCSRPIPPEVLAEISR